MVNFEPLGEQAVLVRLGMEIREETFYEVTALAAELEARPFPGMWEMIPAFTTLTVFYHPHVSSYEQVCSYVEKALHSRPANSAPTSRVVEIPVCYGGEFGPDLEFVAEQNGLDVQEVVKFHTNAEYLVYMIGFAPGFPYLGGMPEEIAAPRKSTPRIKIPAGSVGIAGKQTGVYPLETPGGWQIIGQTPVRLFRPESERPSLLQGGDRVKFRAVTVDEFQAWQEGETP
ncbi:5-oxoprolinase subunit PxpB [Tumebacillus amylolyticus]|uniref:5-oxoprolinase subunit PxpB n=1 Tax=Tumebacillus amylolyticus TaxID=2801339 RepID=UPI0024C06BCB|nr:5-oxoprolinase subunit PxpB [Tumebacillus amylolyticus]